MKKKIKKLNILKKINNIMRLKIKNKKLNIFQKINKITKMLNNLRKILLYNQRKKQLDNKLIKEKDISII